MERRLGPGRLLIAASCLAAGILAVAGVANAGSLYQGCDESAGTMFIDGQTGDVDLFAAGYNAATHKVHAEGTRSGAIMSSITCQSSNWKLFTSTLRDKNDRIRADGYGLTGYGPLPASMKTTLRGGNGADRVVGHPGVDDIAGGVGQDILMAQGGKDMVRAADGYADTVNCGPGQDKAQVDNLDTHTGCEDVVLFVRPPR